MLSHLLHLSGIESVVIEARSRQYCEERVRAGLLEQGTVDLFTETGLGERMNRIGLLHHGLNLRYHRQTHRIDFAELAGGKGVMIYPQQQVLQDLFTARVNAGGQLFFEVQNVKLQNFDPSSSENAEIHFRQGDRDHVIVCDFIAGCDGFHGVSRPSIPSDVLTPFVRHYPFGWLGILAEAPPSWHELIYAHHERGFALLTMRTPQLSRLYLQCEPDDEVSNWPDSRIWEELHTRSASRWLVADGRAHRTKRRHADDELRYRAHAIWKAILAGRGAYCPTHWCERVESGDCGHTRLAPAFIEFYKSSRRELLNRYSDTCLRRVWKVQRFSWLMTAMLHIFKGDNPFDRRRQIAGLDYVKSSRAAAQTLAENYVGLPFG